MQRPFGGGGSGIATPQQYAQQPPPIQSYGVQQQQPQQQPGQPPLLKLKYRVIYCSGEEPEYPVTELLDPTPNSRGWQSQKFCDYPQEIIVQFPNVVKLKQLQFLSHQSKIASKVELFTFVPTGSQQMSSQLPLQEIQFKRLGYLSLDPNERSGFQARELKSVYVDSLAVLLKLIFHKCHLNNFNVFNQIGLVALNCIGINMPAAASAINQELDSVPGSSQSKRGAMDAAGVDFDSGIDPEIANKIRLLEQAKVKAVNQENFDEAKKIKDGMDKMRSVGIHLQQLEERKRMATMNEDYDAAKIIKMEMEKLKQAVFNPWLEEIIQSQMAPYMNAYQMQNQQQQQQPMRYTQQQFNQAQVAPQMPQQFSQSQQNFAMGFQKGTPQMGTSLEDEMGKMNIGGGGPGRQQRMQSPKIEDSISPPSNINNFQNPQQQQRDNSRKQSEEVDYGNPPPVNAKKGVPPGNPFNVKQYDAPIDVDSQVIPAMNQKGKIPQDYELDNGGQEEEDKEAESLTGDKQKQAEPMVMVFGEPYVRKVFSKTWQFREEGINNIESLILNEGGINEGKAFVNGIGVVRYTVSDKMAQVAQRSMQFLTNLCRNLRPILNAQLKGELQFYTEPILSSLADKLGDNLMKVRNSAEDALLAMAEHPAFGIQACLSVLTRPPADKTQQTAKDAAKKSLLSNKHIIGKYSVLLKMLQNYDFSQEQLKESVNYAMKGIQHQLQDVRNVAYKCMSEIYRFMGMEIKQHLKGLRPAQLEQLEQAFNEIDGGAGQGLKKMLRNDEPKETITTNIDPTAGKKGKKAGAGRGQPAAYDDQEDDYNGGGGFGGGAGGGGNKRNVAASKQQPQAMQRQQQQQQNEEQTCGFCGRYDEDFNDESLDIHYWKECPLLVQCWECGQVIEISTLEEHLLEECDQREEYKLCSKCKGVYRMEDFNGHECVRPRPQGAVKCQLCKESVHPANEIGWKKHLLEVKCTANPRLN